jgi:TRAP-type C4-dicarboxylate transport system permease small subunit
VSSVGAPDETGPSSIVSRVETVLLSVLLLGCSGIAAAQIVLRNVFSYSLYWADEWIRLAVLWLAMIGAMAASSAGRHIAIGIVPRYFPKPWHRPAAVISMAFGAIVAGALAYQTFRFVADSRRYGDTVLGELPAWAFQLIMPFGFAVICFRLGRQALDELRPRR